MCKLKHNNFFASPPPAYMTPINLWLKMQTFEFPFKGPSTQICFQNVGFSCQWIKSFVYTSLSGSFLLATLRRWCHFSSSLKFEIKCQSYCCCCIVLKCFDVKNCVFKRFHCGNSFQMFATQIYRCRVEGRWKCKEIFAFSFENIAKNVLKTLV